VSDREKFIHAICSDPKDDIVRSAFADWLKEHDEERRGEFIRVQIELDRLYAEQVELFNDETDWHRCTGVAASWCPNCGDCCCRNREDWMNDDDCPLHCDPSRHCCLDRLARRIEGKREEEAESFDPDWLPDFHGRQREWYFHTFPEGQVPDRPFSFVVSRGFVTELRIGTDDCFRYLKVLFRRHPITRVVLTDFGSNPIGRKRVARINNVPVLRHYPGSVTYLPVGMRDLFRSGATSREYGDRDYDTEPELLEDLSHAICRFGRQLVGLDPAPAGLQLLETEDHLLDQKERIL
jgi:uncharacterized protein (TIGR02996 family)